ncbi:DUF924 family protein [Paracoccus jeotgali]|uniref:DUF924 family protein n=1 Tax=Paracoccus jeotgali TaxID=2065379 RepID=UPI0028A5EE07|nr:DUF924 family protein [Paracoccus jeotgali]
MNSTNEKAQWSEVIGFWFPEGRSLQIHGAKHKALWVWRMRGGAHEAVTRRFSDLTAAAAAGRLAHWAADPERRLALIVLLDQFSRSVWQGSARAFTQDPAALALTREGLSNGHYAALPTPWFKVVFGLPLGHCEGPDHLARLDLLIRLCEEIAAEAPVPLRPIYSSLVKQAHDVRQIVATFGRHPHRNALLGRPSTPEEEAYLQTGDFPHLRAFEARDEGD